MTIIWTNPKDKDSTVVKTVQRVRPNYYRIFTEDNSWGATIEKDRLLINGLGELYGYIELTIKEEKDLKEPLNDNH